MSFAAAVQAPLPSPLPLKSAGEGAPRLGLVGALCFALPADGLVPDWLELIPAPGADGLIRGRDSRSFRMPAADKVAGRFELRLPLDINHSTELVAPKGGEAPAAAWIEELQARNGALWGRVEWTERGADAVRTKAYRFISPAFTHASNGEIHALTSVGLTNTPNFKLALNRALPPTLSRNSAGEGANDEETPMWKLLLAALGLKDDASESDAVTAVNALKTDKQTALNAAESPPLAKFVPRADYDAAVTARNSVQTELQTLKDKGLEAEAEAEISAAQKAGKITPATRDYYTAMCKREGGLVEFRKFVAVATPVVDPKETDTGRDASKTAGGALTEQQRAVCARMGIVEADYAKSLGVAA